MLVSLPWALNPHSHLNCVSEISEHHLSHLPVQRDLPPLEPVMSREALYKCRCSWEGTLCQKQSEGRETSEEQCVSQVARWGSIVTEQGKSMSLHSPGTEDLWWEMGLLWALRSPCW